MSKNIIRKTLTLLLLSAFSHLAFPDELTGRAQSLIEQGKAKEAYVLLEAAEASRAGDINFDLLLGIAAVDSGQATRGVFALERVLAVQPGNVRARAEIARAYLAIGETTTARQEFESAQKQGVPPEVSTTIDRFLDAVERIDTATKPTLRGYLEGAVGYDTNVNVAPNKSSVAIPGFGGLPFTLTDDSRAQGAWYGTLGGGLTGRVPVNGELAVVGGLSGVLRNNAGARQFDNLSADAFAGVVLTRDKNVFSLNAQYNQYELASDRYRTASGLSGQWQHNFDARNQASLFAQYSDLRYTAEPVRNAERWVAGGAYAHAFRAGDVVFASAYGVSERTRDGDAPWLDLSGMGIRLGGQMTYGANTTFFAGGSVEHRRHGDEDPSFLKTRKETQYDLTLGASYVPVRYWRITPRLSFTHNASNTEINKYRRESVSVTIRRDF